MNAEKHFQKGARFERTQAKLELVDDWETIIEACYMASHHYVEAGTEWYGVLLYQQEGVALPPALKGLLPFDAWLERVQALLAECERVAASKTLPSNIPA